MNIKKTQKTETLFKLTVTEKELDYIQLAIAVMLQDPKTHPDWKPRLGPILEKMRKALDVYDD